LIKNKLIIPVNSSSLIGFEIKSSQPARIASSFSSLVEYAVCAIIGSSGKNSFILLVAS